MTVAVSIEQKRAFKRKLRKELKKWGVQHKDVASRAGLHKNRMVEFLREYDPYFNEDLAKTALEMIREKKEASKIKSVA